MLELYFIFYRTPKIMTRLARERNRSAFAWSLIAISAWIGGEFVVAFTLFFIYGIGIALWEWPSPAPPAFLFFTYLAALGAAVACVTIVARILRSIPTVVSFPAPPLPPKFSDVDDVR
jgi:hypothetical protein